jgi:hypothetical protein
VGTKARKKEIRDDVKMKQIKARKYGRKRARKSRRSKTQAVIFKENPIIVCIT